MAGGSLRNHWTRLPEWTPSRRLWAFYVTFQKHAQLHDLVHAYQRELSSLPGLDMVDSAFLHVTIQGVAFNDQLDMVRVQAATDAVGAAIRGLELSAVTVQDATVDTDAIALPIVAPRDLHIVKGIVDDNLRDVLGGIELYRLPEPEFGFDPHISMAYANRSVPRATILSRLERVANGPVSITIENLSLISLAREGNRWWWDYERQLPFGSGVPAARGATRAALIPVDAGV